MTEQILYNYRPFSSSDEMVERSRETFERANLRRSVRKFSPDSFPREVLEYCIRTAGTAPSGAHQQPWHFAVVESPEIKLRIREAAEEEERAFYSERAPEPWLEALAPIGTNAEKPYLEIAPYLVVLFAKNFGVHDGVRHKHYYVSESVGLAAGFFISAVHAAGLCTLTHTPSPMGFLSEILERPDNERPFLLMPVGYPAADATVPDFSRLPLNEIMSVI